MCYNISFLTQKKLAYAKRFGGTAQDIDALAKQLEEFEKRIPPTYHANAWAHPDILVATGPGPLRFQLMEWGLVPHWARQAKDAYLPKNNYPNAVGETMFGKPAFKKAAMEGRCLVVADAFFEHHHELAPGQKKAARKIGFCIRAKDGAPLAMAGIWRTATFTDPVTGESIHKATCSIVTTQANARMAKIHNNPTAVQRNGPRMPAIIVPGMEAQWLMPINDPVGLEQVQACLAPYPESELEDWTVGQLLGKHAIGNKPEALAPVAHAGFSL